MKEKHFTTKMKTLLLGLLMVVAGQNLVGQTIIKVGNNGSADYANLTDAFADINGGSYIGDIEIQVNWDCTESTTAVLYPNTYTGGALDYNTILIYPTATGKTISGSLNTALIELNGANGITFDGRLRNTSGVVQSDAQDLTIVNTHHGDQTNQSSSIRFIGSAENNTVKYCNIKGSEVGTESGTIFFSTAVSGNGNDGNIIEYNNITCDDIHRSTNSVFSLGTSGHENSGIIIRYNNIYNFMLESQNSNGINLNSFTTACTIKGNSFYETTSFAPTSTLTMIPIFIKNASGTGFVIEDNFIGGQAASCGGSSPWTKTNLNDNIFHGIHLEVGTGGTASSVQNNTIKNISWANSGSAEWAGIYIKAGDVNIGTITANTIGATTGTGSITVTGGGITGGTNVYGINLYGSGTVDCQNNIIGAITSANASSTLASNFYGIYKYSTAGTTTMSNNKIGSVVTSSSINASSSCTDNNPQIVYGIYNLGTGNITIGSNVISKLYNSTVRTGIATRGLIGGIYSSDGTDVITSNTIYDLSIANGNNVKTQIASVTGIALIGSTLKTVTGNTIYNLSNNYTSFSGGVIGLYIGGSTGGNVIRENYIHNLSVNASSTNASIYGIKMEFGASTYTNNIISLGGTTATTLYGIYETGATGSDNNTLLHNTVYIGSDGSSLGSGITNPSYALYSAVTTNTRNFRNNIFANTRSTTGGSNLHYAEYIAASGGTITNDYNDYYVSGTGGTLGYYGAVKTALPVVTSQDVHSANLDPLFTTSGGTSATDYHIKSNLIGATGTGITTDYIAAAREATIPTMGALEDHNYWRGTTSNDWSVTTNWSKNVVPLSGDNVIFDLVHANIHNHLQMDAANDRIVYSIFNDQSTYRTVLNGKHLTVKGALAFTNSAQVEASATTSILEFNGNAQQTIPAGALYNNDVYDLTINNASDVLLYGTANLLHTLTASAGYLDAITNTPTFVYKGSAAQTIGTSQFKNDQIYNLTIWNASGVTLNNTVLTTVTNTFTIETTGKLTIPVNRQLTAAGTTDNRGGVSGLVIKSFWSDAVDATQRGTGSFISYGNLLGGAAIGSGTVERYMDQLQWHLVSPPAIEDLYTANTGFLARPINLAIPYWDPIGTNKQLGIATYDVANNTWNPFFIDGGSGIFNASQGYLVRTARYDGPGGTGTNHGPTVIDFQGTLTSNSQTFTLSRGGDNGVMGWNCIGNPFTSAITLYDGVKGGLANNFLDVNGSLLETKYLGIYILNAGGTYDIINYASPATNAALGQGFFVKAAANGNVVSFTKSMQLHELEYLGTPFKSATTSWPSIKLTAAFGAAQVSTSIKFIDGTTTGLDIGYDAGLFRTDAPNALYTRLVEDAGIGFQLQCLPANQYNTLSIPVGIESKAGGEVTFSAEALNLDAGCNVILEDKLTKRFTDLTRGTYKTLIVPNTVSTDRFFLHTADIMSGIGDQPIGSLNAYAFNNSEIRIIGEVGSNATANLYDVLGRLVVSHILGDVNYNVISIPSVKKGVYLLNIVTKDTTRTIKVMVRN